MDALYEIQLDLQKKIALAYKNFKAKGQGKMNKASATVRMDNLSFHYQTFCKNHNQILSNHAANKEHDYFKLKIPSLVEESYIESKCEFKEFLDNLEDQDRTHLEANTSTAVLAQAANVSSSYSLAKIELPVFSGKYGEWAHFRDLFKSMIHRREEIPPVVKFYHLKTKLQGEALDQIKNLEITADNYPIAWTTVCAFYENKRRLVNQSVSSLFSIKPMKSESFAEIKRLYSCSFDTLSFLEGLERPVDKDGTDLFVFMTVSKFDVDTRKDWEKLLGKSQTPPTIDQLKDFLMEHMSTLEAIENSGKSNTVHQTGKRSNQEKSHSLVTGTDSEAPKRVCPGCSENHHLSQCDSFKAKSVEDRKAFVSEKRLCYLCFGAHGVNYCKSRKFCRKCNGKHHTFIHPECDPPPGDKNGSARGLVSSTDDKRPGSSQKTSSNSTTVCLKSVANSGFVLLPTAVVRVLSTDGFEYFFTALVDHCSQSSFVTENVCQKLGIGRSQAKVKVSGVADLKSFTSRGIASFTVMPRFPSDFACKVEALIVPKVSAYKVSATPSANNWGHLQGLRLADPNFLRTRPIDILLGAKVHAQIVLEGIKKDTSQTSDQPIATNTELGWIISSCIGSSSESVMSNSFFHLVDYSMLDLLVEKFWKQEELPTQKIVSEDDRKCEEHFVMTHSQDASGRYIVRLPVKENALRNLNFDLGDSYNSALKVLLSMERKFEKDQNFHAQYRAFINEYINLSHMELVPNLSSEDLKLCLFLAHHGVLQGTKKLRVVFNGSGKIHGISLNDLLYTGENLLPELFDLILKWRRYAWVFVADIEKMFRQILVDPEDRHLQMILWRDRSTSEVLLFFLKTITYGLKCSPFLAIRTLRQLAADYGHLFELAIKIIEEESYMDDFASGGDTKEEAKEKQSHLIELLKVGGFELRKWAANDPALLERIPPAHRINGSTTFEIDDCTSILGLSWSPKEDYFHFRIKLQSCDTPSVTKRGVLSLTAKIFDPLGWLAPVVVWAKIFLQSLWLLKCDWDDTLPAEYSDQWTKWYKRLPSLEDVRIPRWIGLSAVGIDFIEIHGFADASSKAYGAVLYLRMVKGAEVLVSLQCAKSKVAPIKTISIPRLELCAAHLLVKLTDHFVRTMPIKFTAVHLWSDSRDVLCWIRAPPNQWQTFVANRCSQIQTLLPQAYWHHVRTKENPADIISRGLYPELLLSFELWWKGPPFLSESAESWRTEAEEIKVQPLEERVFSLNVEVGSAEPNDLLTRYSSSSKLFRVTALCLRFILKLEFRLNENKRKKMVLPNLEFLDRNAISAGPLSSAELLNAELLWVYLVQKDEFCEALKGLQVKSSIRNSSIVKLYPFLDKGLLRVGGRLRHSELDYAEKHPLILPKKGELTTLLARRAHLQSLHGGTQLTLTSLRTQYWVLQGRQAVKSIIGNCTVCLRYSAKMSTQIMGDLPKVRTTPAHPFEHTGVDYAGPFKVRLSKSRGKGTMKAYVSVFVCLSTRAVHLEAVEDYSAEAFIAAFKRLTSRRGHCAMLLSDRGTNFVGADAELRRRFDEASRENQAIALQLTNLGTEWKFNPPAAPHFAGLCEAAVKSAKHHLKRLVGDHVLNFVELSTLLCQIEACLNSRPLTTLTDDPSDLAVLTPAHLLIQRPSFVLPEPSVPAGPVPLTKRWLWMTQLAQQFWRSWSKDYLQALQERRKWLKASRSFRPGDVVLMRDNLSSPAVWPLALITKVLPGRDGKVRVVELRTASSTFTRPVVKLVLLVPDSSKK